MSDAIFKMSLHDEIQLDKQTTVLRVPGGWIYTIGRSRIRSGLAESQITSQFVPHPRVELE